ncbi:MAG: hypothetical protein D6776_11030 [Planctomycetota bacterium]|nr:MAG: hypothetical protein D6776_11030 [Planctomycetota bacterium]
MATVKRREPPAETGDASGALLSRTRELATALRELRCMEGTELGERFDALRRRALALLDGKIVPELSADMKLPLFVAVCGGTNTGKSTVVNALAGMLLTETRVTAGATKHPFLYLHRRWRERMLGGEIFPGARCVELESPVQLTVPSDEPLLYLSFHERRELQSVAIVDSPDLDSVERRNRAAAEVVLTLADVCLFVTTPQKYKDRVLVEAIREVLGHKKRVVLLFNQVEDEIIYNTIVDDLGGQLAGVKLGGFVPLVRERHPEVTLRPRVTELVQPFLDTRRRLEIKRRTMRAGLASLLGGVRELIETTRAEARTKQKIVEEALAQLARAEGEYRASAALPFPESALALRRRLAASELHRWIPAPRAAAAGQTRALVRQLPAWSGRSLTRLFADSLDSARPPEDWEAFRAERDAQDLVRVQQLALLLRSRIDARLRAQATHSQLALALLHRFFGDDDLERYERAVETAFEAQRAERGDEGRRLLETVPDPDTERLPVGPAGRALAAVWKLAGGVGLALATGGLGGWDVLWFPGGVLGAGYGIAALEHLRLRRWRERFERARLERFRRVCETVLIEPFLEAVREVASESDLGRLERLCDEIEAAGV